MIFLAFACFAASLIVNVLVVRSAHLHGGMSADSDLSGPQKVHVHPVPRIGGLSAAVGLVVGAAILQLAGRDPTLHQSVWLLLLCAVPAFGVGLLEDLTKRIRPRYRMLLLAVSSAMAVWLLDAVIHRSAIAGLDTLLEFWPLAVALTIFASVGVSNAVNIIDGFNGLASMCTIIMLAGFAFVAYEVNDPFVMTVAIIALSATLGFFVLNYPGGLIFLGDGGAYMLGFLLAQLSILLVGRHPEVSPFFPIVLCAYPIIETLFSIYRRRLLRGQSPSEADGMHLHSLIYRRLMRWSPPTSARQRKARNSLTSPYLWILCLASAIPACIFWNRTPVLLAVLAAFVGGYLVLYWRIVRFKTPKFLIFGLDTSEPPQRKLG